MHFSDIQISNFKSYKKSPRLELATGINIIVGKNNAGKTALLDALSLKFDANPHRTTETMPTPLRRPKQESVVTVTVTLTKDELLDLLVHTPGDLEFRLALPDQSSPAWTRLALGGHIETAGIKFGEWFFSHSSFTFRIQREAYGTFPEENWYVSTDTYIHPYFERAPTNEAPNLYSKFKVDPIERTFSFLGFAAVGGGGGDDFILRICRSLNRYVYRFRAERVPALPCEFTSDPALASDSSNLASVLNLLQGTPSQFSKFNRLVREILPDIHQVGIRLLNGNKVEVIVWNDERAAFSEHLAFSLNESGTGLAQVLAIMYVVIAAREPQVIILDEPQGFLHPGAVRKLIEVLRNHTKDKHQLIIATHSPTVISSADPVSVTMIRQSGAESVFDTIDIRKADEQRGYLSAVGARLSDVFGYDRILWVEGETEEKCFPLIVRELSAQPLIGTAILRVQHTGDFNRRDAKNVFSIYERLSHLEGGLVPPVIGFIFDQDARSEKDLRDLEKQSNGRIRFIGKRLFENYLLNPQAIAVLMNSLDEERKDEVTEAQVQTWIDENKSDPKYYKPLKLTCQGAWSDEVNGARLLEDLFPALSEGRVYFEKTTHSPFLTKWILANSSDDLKDLSQLLSHVLT